ncbi:MAG: hypothetical protein HY562_13055 [Ignavibacteriales bacterium]|nr:hypothetical protein [Ignavibacteriales bacterium]
MNSKNRYVIGMDGGGTKTAAMLADMNGAVRMEVVGGPSNFQMIGVERASDTLYGLIESCCTKAGVACEEVVAIVAGLTGAGRQSDKDRMREGFRAFAGQKGSDLESIIIESDARIALEGAFRGRPGIVLIAGTGSIAFAKDTQGTIHRVGGWGRMLGDEGSGYAIGRDGLNAVTKHLDGRGKPTLLTSLVAEKFGFTPQERIIAAVYRENFDIASVAPLVLETASKRDSLCVRIIDNAAEELYKHARALTSQLKSLANKKGQRIPLTFIGSLAGGENMLSKLLKGRISAKLKRVKIVRPEASPAYGAVLMALDAVRKRP